MTILNAKKIVRHIAITLVFAILLFLHNKAIATDKQLLDTLTQKGVLTDDEAKNIAKSMVEVPVVFAKPQQQISISGRLQTQYAFLENHIREGLDAGMSNHVNGVILRRMIVAFDIDISETCGSVVSVDYSLPHYASDMYVYKDVDTNFLEGQLRVGYLKPNFVVEEYTSSRQLYCIERSIATNFWSGSNGERKLGLGGMFVGVWWYGKSQTINGLNYFLGISNSENYEIDIRDIHHGGAHNMPSLWGAVFYDKKINNALDFRVGINLAYGALTNKVPYNEHPSGIFGVNPFLALKGENFRINTELMLGEVEKGRHVGTDYHDCSPFGFNFMCEYLFDAPIGRWGPVFRYTFLDTDGRGVSTSDGLRKSVTIDSDFYDKAQGFYFGVNWYILENNLKLQFGYEFAKFKDEVGTSGNTRLNADTYRAQMQIQF